tara:strand:- start:154 stop:414 length:261 start_codon:yes stop_codon:yes gene_type:complete
MGEKVWYVYLVKCSDLSLYCGITTCIDRRINEHNNTKKGAKYTRSRRPVSLVGFTSCKSRSEALKIEAKVKRLSKNKKVSFFNSLA